VNEEQISKIVEIVTIYNRGLYSPKDLIFNILQELQVEIICEECDNIFYSTAQIDATVIKCPDCGNAITLE
jgi:DNA-directed RNA polymerase subunit RPC12/RpoP